MTRHRSASQHDPCDHTSPLYKRHRDRFNQWASCELCRNSGGCIIWLQFACCFLALVQVWDNVPEQSTGLPFLQASNFSYSTSQDKPTGASMPKTRSSHPAVLTEPTRDRRMDTAKPQQQAYRATVMTKQPFLSVGVYWNHPDSLLKIYICGVRDISTLQPQWTCGGQTAMLIKWFFRLNARGFLSAFHSNS